MFNKQRNKPTNQPRRKTPFWNIFLVKKILWQGTFFSSSLNCVLISSPNLVPKKFSLSLFFVKFILVKKIRAWDWSWSVKTIQQQYSKNKLLNCFVPVKIRAKQFTKRFLVRKHKNDSWPILEKNSKMCCSDFDFEFLISSSMMIVWSGLAIISHS